MLLVPYGLNPDETWELDLTPALARSTIQSLRTHVLRRREEAAKAEGDPAAALLKQADTLEAKAVALEAELAAYEPGSGPVFIVGPIPNGMRAEISGEAGEISGLDRGVEWAKRDSSWCEKVVRWAIRDHRNLRTRAGVEIAFQAEAVQWDGRERKVVSRETLEAYQPFLGDLALEALRSQRLDEAGKNA